MKTTGPVRSNTPPSSSASASPGEGRRTTSGGPAHGRAVDQRHTGCLRGGGEGAERAPRDLGWVVVGPALDHDADLDGDEAAVASRLHRPQVARVVEVALAGGQELVGRITAALILQVGVDRVR